jgi:hypothetical protein
VDIVYGSATASEGTILKAWCLSATHQLRG